MKVYLVHKGTLNSNYGCYIHGIFSRLKLAEDIVKCFPHDQLQVTELEVIE